MQLQPRRPPGRADRKAAVYASEIRRLRDDGYTYEAIREALADIGIKVSASTLQREMRRAGARAHQHAISNRDAAPAPLNASPMASANDAPDLAMAEHRSGRDVAEAFFTTHSSNPLLRSRERS